MVWYRVVNRENRPVGRQVMLFETTSLIFRPAFLFDTTSIIWSLTFQISRLSFLSLLDSFYALWILRLGVSFYVPHQGKIFETTRFNSYGKTFWDTADQLILPVSFCWALGDFPQILSHGFLIRADSFYRLLFEPSRLISWCFGESRLPVSKWQT